jgi:hypothetical protein
MNLRRFPITVWQKLQHPQIVFYALLYFMALMVVGTIAQKYIGLFPATKEFFNSFIVWYGVLPLPAGASILTLLFINLLCHFIARSRWNIQHLGISLAHLGALVLLLGGGMTLAQKHEGFILLRQNETTQNVYAFDQNGSFDFKLGRDKKLALPETKWQLPFTLTLEDFKQDYYQGTDVAQKYESDLQIQENGKSWPVQVAMNSPYRYKNYTFYQSSVLTLPNKETASVVNVVSNPGWLFPYIATGLLFFGLALHAGMRRHGKK